MDVGSIWGSVIWWINRVLPSLIGLLFHFVDSVLMPVPYLSLESLSVPSFPPSAFGTPDFLSLIFRTEHQSLQPFSAFGIGYDIDDGSLVLEGPSF